MKAEDGRPFPVATRRIADAVGARRAARAEFGAPSVTWRRGPSRLEGWGTAARLVFTGPHRVRLAGERWRALADSFVVDDEVRVPGSGPVAFGAFAFADESQAQSVLVVPRVVVGERDGVAFRTELPIIAPDTAPAPASGTDAAALSPDGYRLTVAGAVRRIEAGELAKVVLARDEVQEGPVDLAAALTRLAARYRAAWVFAIDGFFGASPETLVTVRGRTFGSRVLAGTASRHDDPEADDAARATLLDSAKNRFEHALAVDSLLLTLADTVDGLSLGRPFALGLPNVWHLATDATARVRPGVGVLDLVAALHPTAAVAGSPRAAALRAIAELEPFDRRRYAGPVGWIDADGDGEWAIGLRSAEVEGPDRVRAFAGAGIVAGSDPDQELAETEWKLAPIREALLRRSGWRAPAPHPA